MSSPSCSRHPLAARVLRWVEGRLLVVCWGCEQEWT